MTIAMRDPETPDVLDHFQANGYSPYLFFDSEEWAHFRADTPLTLTADEVKRLRSIDDPIDLSEVRRIYLSLSRLLTRAWMEGHRTDGVAIDPEWLRADHQGLFAIIGRQSLAGRLALTARHDLAEQHLADWQRTFGEDLHLELTRTQREGEEAFNAFALHAAGTRGMPVIASNDVRFLSPDDFDAHEARVCIASGRVLDDPKRPREYSAEQYMKSAEQMAELFADVPDAIDNTRALAQRCNMSRSTFLRTFRKAAAATPGELLMRVRMARAASSSMAGCRYPAEPRRYFNTNAAMPSSLNHRA